jgi:hypothetical protein
MGDLRRARRLRHAPASIPGGRSPDRRSR